MTARKTMTLSICASGLRQGGKRLRGKISGGLARCITRINALDPCLGRRALGCVETVEFATRSGNIVAARGGGNARNHATSIVRRTLTNRLDADEPGCTCLKPIDQTGWCRLGHRLRFKLRQERDELTR